MPILDIQERFRELGRIRTGITEATGKTYQRGPRKGQPIMRPKKLPRFRLTSPWPHLIERAAEAYGGEARPATIDGLEQYEVIVATEVLPVVVPPGEVLDQWYELWEGGGLVKRCDGVRQAIRDAACSCPKDPDERQALAAEGKACKPTTRLRLMLPDVPDVGIWRLESHGFHAAAELSGSVSIVELASRSGVMIPAELRLMPREGSRRPGQPRRKFYVPALSFRGNLGTTLEALGMPVGGEEPVSIRSGPVEPRPALDAGGRAELPAAGSSFDPTPVEPAGFGEEPPAELPPAEPDDDEILDAEEVEEPEPAAIVEPTPDLDEEPVDEHQAEHEDEGTLTGPQRIAMLFRDGGVVDRDVRLRIVSRLIGREVTSGKDLTAKEQGQVIRALRDPATLARITSPPAEPAYRDEDPDSGPAPATAGPEEQPESVPACPPAPAPGEPPADLERWDHDDWKAAIMRARCGVVEVLRCAQATARAEQVKSPVSFDAFVRESPAVVKRAAWELIASKVDGGQGRLV